MTRIDIGCDDFDRAEFNRYIVANKLFIVGYVLAEEAIERTPLSQPLASWIPQGTPPRVGKKDWQQFRGGQDWGIEEAVPEVVGT